MINIFDIVKLIMSFFVVAVHTNPLISFSENANFYLVNTLGRIPVPIFFSISGFFLFKNLNKEKKNYYQYTIKYLKKITIIYIIWSLIYFIPYYLNNTSPNKLIEFIPHIFTDGVYSQLWYLKELIVGVILTTIINQKIGIKKTLIISLIFYIVGILLVPYFPLIEKIFNSSNSFFDTINYWGKMIGRNGLLFGMFFITLGGYIASKKHKVNNKICFLGLLLSIILLIGETTLIRKIGGQYYGIQISLIPLTYFSINSMLYINEKTFKKYDTYSIRILSFLIYLIHEWVHLTYIIISTRLITISIFKNSLISYIIILVVTILISITIIHFSKKDKFKFLKKLYS